MRCFVLLKKFNSKRKKQNKTMKTKKIQLGKEEGRIVVDCTLSVFFFFLRLLNPIVVHWKQKDGRDFLSEKPEIELFLSNRFRRATIPLWLVSNSCFLYRSDGLNRSCPSVQRTSLPFDHEFHWNRKVWKKIFQEKKKTTILFFSMNFYKRISNWFS